MTSKFLVGLSALSLMTAGCVKTDDGDSEDEGIEMSFGGDDEADDDDHGTKTIKIGGEGDESKFSIKANGFSLDVDIPAFSLDSDDFNMNNVSLYPGSKVTGLNVEDGDEGGKVTMNFTAPTGVGKLTSWFEEKMKAEDFVVAIDGTKLSGETDEGDAFSLELTEKSSEETAGKLEFLED